MPKTQTIFVCQQCGSQQPRWMGRCPDCGTWDSLVEQAEPRAASSKRAAGSSAHVPREGLPVKLRDVTADQVQRYIVWGEEFSRVLGNGIVPGSLVLIGGDPGIGKSTMLTQVAAAFAEQYGIALYVSAEESPQQIKMRAERIIGNPDRLYVSAETGIDGVIEQIHTLKPQLVIVDSIQTVYAEDISSAAGSVSQVRECAMRLLQVAKATHTAIFLVGHVTKEGAIAGPRALEHIVDAVIYLEGDQYHHYRLLRAVKNRFGSTNEVGVFEMTQDGMKEVTNPSHLFIAERNAAASGSTVLVSLEGTRPLLVEAQGLTSNTGNAMPRRTANGFDQNRLLLLVAVLTKRVGLPLFNQDIYVNIVGGLRLNEPAADLAVAVAIASSFHNRPIDPHTVFIGEVGLSGELRSSTHLERRLQEASKLGFRRACVPTGGKLPHVENMELVPMRSVVDVIDRMVRRSSGEGKDES